MSVLQEANKPGPERREENMNTILANGKKLFGKAALATVALGGFGSVFGAFAGGIIVGLVEATTALILPPSLKSVGIYAVYLLVVFVRPRGLFGSI